MRVASLLASATETICALGFQGALVARSHECDWPPGIENLPAVTEPRLAIRASSAAIDREIKALVREALSIYLVDAERLRALAPDVVVTQTQCEVCAVSEGDVERALGKWTGARPRVVSLRPDDLAAAWDDMRAVARALGAPDRGEGLVTELTGRMEEVAARSHALPARPRVACVEWIEPLMAAGNWMPELVEMAGGVNLFGEAGRHSPWMTWEELADADPDVILVSPCGFDLARTRAEMGPLVSRDGWAGLRAVREGRVALADGMAYFHRPGPRLAESLEILAEVLHPGIEYGWRAKAWGTL